MKWLQIKLPDELHDAFKKKSEKDNSTMSDKVREWVRKYMGE